MMALDAGPNDVKPMVAILDERNCETEISMLEDVATIAFCDAKRADELREEVFNEAFGAFMWRLSLNKEELKRFRKLKIIVTVGSGVENIDVQEAGKRGIAVCTVPGVEEAANTTISMIADLYKKMYGISDMIDDGMPSSLRMPECSFGILGLGCTKTALTLHDKAGEAKPGAVEIHVSTLGVIGLGHFGTAVALRASELGFHVFFYDPYLPDTRKLPSNLKRVHSIQHLFAQSDCLSLHCPLNDRTHHLINEQSIKMMRPGAFLVNTAVGGLVDEVALAEALRQRQIRAAGMDIQENEPNVELERPLSDAPNLIWRPRVAFYNEDSYEQFRKMAARKIRVAITKGISGLQNCVNKEFLMPGGHSR